MTNAKPDAYIVNVLGKTRNELVSIGKKKDDATLDDGAAKCFELEAIDLAKNFVRVVRDEQVQ